MMLFEPPQDGLAKRNPSTTTPASPVPGVRWWWMTEASAAIPSYPPRPNI